VFGVGLFLFMWSKSCSVYRGEVIEQNDKIEKLEKENKKYREEEKKRDEIRKRFHSYCNTTQNPKVCEAVAKAGIEVEEAIDFEGLAKFSVILGRSEQNYHCPPNSYNCFGIGAYTKHHYKRFGSYIDATVDLANLLKKYGYKSVSPSDFLAISYWYKGVPCYECWAGDLKIIWEEIG